MQIAKLVLEYVKALVWPVVLVFATITFKTQIAALIERIKHLRGAGAEVEFAEVAAAILAETAVVAEQRAPENHEQPSSGDTVALSLHEVLEPLLAVHPGIAVLKGWDLIQNRLTDLAARAYPATHVSVLRGTLALRMLEDRGLPGATVRSITRLRALRNAVAHPRDGDTPITEEGGRDYVDAAVNVWEALTAFEHRLRDEPTGN
ncbi:hypothetical protein [Streptomyces sp. NPDC001070]